MLFNCANKGLYNSAKLYISKGHCKNKGIIELAKNEKNKSIVEDWFIAVLIGKINFIKYVKGKDNYTYLNFANQLNKIVGKKLLIQVS